jgi:hypothetical protein
MLGTFAGDILVYSARTGEQDATLNCHNSAVSSMAHSKVFFSIFNR